MTSDVVHQVFDIGHFFVTPERYGSYLLYWGGLAWAGLAG
jgi:hypothetical protein